MKKIFALLLSVSASALAQDHSYLAIAQNATLTAIGKVILFTIAGVIWGICAVIFKVIGKKK